MRQKIFQFLSILYIVIVLTISNSIFCFSQVPEQQKQELAGEFYGMPVPISNYYFAKRVVMTFNASWRGTPKDEKELEDVVWQELLFSYEAFRRNIQATKDEIDDEIDKMLKAEKTEFKWRIDKEDFKKWTQEKLGVSQEVFRNQVMHLVTLEKLKKQVIDSIEPEVTEDEAYQKFLDEYNSLSVELIQFEDLDKAKKFYDNLKKEKISGRDWNNLIWDDLLLSQAAVKEKIEVTQEEVDSAIEMKLRHDKVKFKWKEEGDTFKNWVRKKTGLSDEVFRDRIRQLLKIDKLRQKIFSSEAVDIRQEDEYKKFLDKNKTIDKAYKKFFGKYTKSKDDILRFKTSSKAKEFYEQIDRQPGVWEDKKRQEPKNVKRPGFVALDFLIHMWGFKREDVYKVMELDPSEYYPPSAIYKDYAVFKILELRQAEPDKFKERKDYYFERVKMIKKYDGYKEWAKELKEKANLKIYIK